MAHFFEQPDELEDEKLYNALNKTRLTRFWSRLISGKLRSIPDEGAVSVDHAGFSFDLAHGFREAEKHPRRRRGVGQP